MLGSRDDSLASKVDWLRLNSLNIRDRLRKIDAQQGNDLPNESQNQKKSPSPSPNFNARIIQSGPLKVKHSSNPENSDHKSSYFLAPHGTSAKQMAGETSQEETKPVNSTSNTRDVISTRQLKKDHAAVFKKHAKFAALMLAALQPEGDEVKQKGKTPDNQTNDQIFISKGAHQNKPLIGHQIKTPLKPKTATWFCKPEFSAPQNSKKHGSIDIVHHSAAMSSSFAMKTSPARTSSKPKSGDFAKTCGGSFTLIKNEVQKHQTQKSGPWNDSTPVLETKPKIKEFLNQMHKPLLSKFMAKSPLDPFHSEALLHANKSQAARKYKVAWPKP